MTARWENQFVSWARSLSDTEATRCENAERMVREAIGAHPVPSENNIRVFTQGSYRNNTNVRAESDIDIAVCCDDIINADYDAVPGLNDSIAGLQEAEYTTQLFRDDVGEALEDFFGAARVTSGSKAFDLHANSYAVDADVVPCIEHRRYTSRSGWLSGTAIYPVSGHRIINWPEQNYDNGVAKNKRTNLNFKKLVRVIKNLRNDMAESGIDAAEPIPSYFIECLVWNVPDAGFAHTTFSDDVRYILAHLYNSTMNAEDCDEWGEENELKYLFREGQPWTREQSNDFLDAAWNYVGYT